MTWNETTQTKPANSVDVLGWTGEKYVVASYFYSKASPGSCRVSANWIVADEFGEVMYHDADYITHWQPLPESPARLQPVTEQKL